MVRVKEPGPGSTLLAMAKALLNTWFMSSSEKVDGSPASFTQVIVTGPPDVAFVGVLIWRADTNGMRMAKRLSLTIVFGVIEARG